MHGQPLLPTPTTIKKNFILSIQSHRAVGLTLVHVRTLRVVTLTESSERPCACSWIMNLVHPIPLPPLPPTGKVLFSPRGARLATRLWPCPNPKALLLFVHGGGWHSGYFEEIALSLSKNASIYCAGYDQIGCGYSEPDPDTPSPGVTHVRSFDWYVEDTAAAIQWMQGEAQSETLPVVVLGESFGALEVFQTALDRSSYGCKVDACISLGGLLKVHDHFLPPRLVVQVLCFMAHYYPRVIMPATDFESTFDDAFGDKEWARTARADSKISSSIRPTIGGVAATLTSGAAIRGRGAEWELPLLAIHGRHDCRTSFDVMQEFIDKIGPQKATMVAIDTTGHQLLQDKPEVIQHVIETVMDWLKRTIPML